MLDILHERILRWCLSQRKVKIEDLLLDSTPNYIPGPDGKLKFTAHRPYDNLYVKTEGSNTYARVRQGLTTVEYEVYELTLADGHTLRAADKHLVILSDGRPCALEDLSPGDLVKTVDGCSAVERIRVSGSKEVMYDLELLDDSHIYYTNDILSHNTQTISMYLLWVAMFTRDQTILIASKNNSHAMEILDRIRFAYEELPDWLKAGCKYYNKHNIEFDNGSRIKSEATTEKTGRGLSISILYLDELAFISPRVQNEMWKSLAPTLSTGGQAIISSTPNGDTDLFSTLWRGAKSGTNSFKSIFFPWYRHPERGEGYLKQMEGELGRVGLRQEVLCVSEDTIIETNEGVSPIKQVFEALKTAKELITGEDS
jgi:hypothetical protein